MSSNAPPLIYVIAGEPSGDLLGGRMMAALSHLTDGQLRFAGIGGEQMRAQGLDSLFPMSELSIMGLVEVLPRALKLLRRIDQTVEAIIQARPAAVVTIDSPGFTWRVARKLRQRKVDFPLIHYVAPQVWAWKPERAVETAHLFDRLMVLLPFEPPFFEKEGLATDYVGHPAIESVKGDGPAFRARHGIKEDATLLGVLPGSRQGEVTRLLPVFGKAVARLARRYPDLQVVLPAVASQAARIKSVVASWPLPVTLIEPGERYDAFAACDVAMAASGTVTLELTLSGLPFVTAYKVNPITAAIIRRAIKVDYVTLSNVILGRPAIPELLQECCTPETLEQAVARLLSDPQARRAQMTAFAEVRSALAHGDIPPSEQAARAVLRAIEG
ncbi:lipid-A-disaccharide synthase [Telmatospirillum sp. J64-1]|uniref:lipid-A-disaccharide synthase n=1 Tax=Telmatospirillum sp. J64-1 TaxID=2502183 RepID=UPI00210230E6|nr:lipid-A-disaccharide synthase [Telmatospirillum sp. J64-1]